MCMTIRYNSALNTRSDDDEIRFDRSPTVDPITSKEKMCTHPTGQFHVQQIRVDRRPPKMFVKRLSTRKRRIITWN